MLIAIAVAAFTRKNPYKKPIMTYTLWQNPLHGKTLSDETSLPVRKPPRKKSPTIKPFTTKQNILWQNPLQQNPCSYKTSTTKNYDNPLLWQNTDTTCGKQIWLATSTHPLSHLSPNNFHVKPQFYIPWHCKLVENFCAYALLKPHALSSFQASFFVHQEAQISSETLPQVPSFAAFLPSLSAMHICHWGC